MATPPPGPRMHGTATLSQMGPAAVTTSAVKATPYWRETMLVGGGRAFWRSTGGRTGSAVPGTPGASAAGAAGPPGVATGVVGAGGGVGVAASGAVWAPAARLARRAAIRTDANASGRPIGG